jgi:hypothetical protein
MESKSIVLLVSEKHNTQNIDINTSDVFISFLSKNNDMLNILIQV